MASGSFDSGGWGVVAKVNWSSSKVSNGSNVSATLIAQNVGGYYWHATIDNGYNLNIDGKDVSGSGLPLSSAVNGHVALLTNSKTVNYTGDKIIGIHAQINCNGIVNSAGQNLGVRTAINNNIRLDKVGSAPTMGRVTAPTTGVLQESLTFIPVTWTKASSYNGACTYEIEVSINGMSYNRVTTINNINTTGYEYSIRNASPGTRYRFRILARNDIGASNYEYSGTVTLSELSPPTIGNIDTFNPYVKSTLTVPLSGGSQTGGGSYRRMAELHCGNSRMYSCTTPSYGNTSVEIPTKADEIATALGKSLYSSSIMFKIVAWIENSSGERSSTVVKTFTVNLNSDGGATPTLGTPTLSGGEFGFTDTCFVEGASTVKVSSPNATLRRAPTGTTISYRISCTGVNPVQGQSGSFSNLTSGLKTFEVTATDSRGLSTTSSVQCMVQPYSRPSIIDFKSDRLNNPNTSAQISYVLKYTEVWQYPSINVKGQQLNGINSQECTKDNGVNWVPCTSGQIFTDLATDIVYSFKLRVTDKLRPTTYTESGKNYASTEKVNLAMRKSGIGINVIPQAGVALDVGGTVAHNGKRVLTGNDDWLRVNEADDFPNGIFCSNSIVRTDGQFQIGDNGSKFIADANGHVKASGNVTARGYVQCKFVASGMGYAANTGHSILQAYSGNKMQASMVLLADNTLAFQMYNDNTFTSVPLKLNRNGSIGVRQIDLWNKENKLSNEIKIGSSNNTLWFNNSKCEGSVTTPTDYYFGNGSGGRGNIYANDIKASRNITTSSFNADEINTSGDIYADCVYSNRKLYAYNGTDKAVLTEDTASRVNYLQTGSSGGGPYLHVSSDRYGDRGILYDFSSDLSIKHGIVPSGKTALDKINKIKFYDFTYNQDLVHVNLGLVAQQLQSIDDDFVSFRPYKINGTQGILSVNTYNMIVYLLKACQELQQQIDELKGGVLQ